MRELLYIPVIHVESDLGSMATSITKRSLEICGTQQWERHKEIVTAFWDRLEDYFGKIDPRGMQIFQDGLMAGGEIGRRIIEEGAKRGSRNYQIVLDLIKRGGEIKKTEDIELLKKELHRVLQLSETIPELEEDTAAIKHSLDGERLMQERDRFMAGAINQTLKEGEKGILFIGAFHNVVSQLAHDVEVKEVKSSEKVRDYFKALISGDDTERFDELARYMVSSVDG